MRLTPDARVFHQRHAGETALIVCNGPSLRQIPLDFLTAYPSFGCNTVVEWEAFVPTYYVAVDDRVRREYGVRILERFGEIPKFIPVPNLEGWQGPQMVHWFHRPGTLWPQRERFVIDPTWLMDPGITWYAVPHAMLQIAAFMGFTTLLIVGMDHSENRKEHAWGVDEAMPGTSEAGGWWEHVERGHARLLEGLGRQGVRILNLSPETRERVFPKACWQDWSVN